MSTDPDKAQTELRQELVTELWAIVSDDEVAGAARVAAIKEIARLEGVDKPAPKGKAARFRSLADFYAEVDEADDEPAEEEI